jgi:hypothetical protein
MYFRTEFFDQSKADFPFYFAPNVIMEDDFATANLIKSVKVMI